MVPETSSCCFVILSQVTCFFILNTFQLVDITTVLALFVSWITGRLSHTSPLLSIQFILLSVSALICICLRCELRSGGSDLCRCTSSSDTIFASRHIRTTRFDLRVQGAKGPRWPHYDPWSLVILFQFPVRFPKAMKHSLLCPLPAGSAIVRDLRLWHGGTPSGSSAIRFLDQILKPEASDTFVNLQSEYVIE